MRVLVTANLVPFMRGGADYHVSGLVEQLRLAGHEVELLQLPFRFSPASEVERLMDFAEVLDLNRPNGVDVDRVISLQFPGYGVQHKDHTVWVMHQHRAVYELYSQQPKSKELAALREAVTAFDKRVLSKPRKLFANSHRVAERIAHYNGLQAEPLYHPPAQAEAFYCDEALNYVFAPSRLEPLKRQELLIEAACHLQTSVKILIGGTGGHMQRYQRLISERGVEGRVQLIGGFSEAEKRVLYARALGVVFVPFDEDYGYVTLEGMLSSKPVITCSDAGGPCELVENAATGFVLSPEPKLIAEHIDRLFQDRDEAERLGMAGRKRYFERDISWGNVLAKLLG